MHAPLPEDMRLDRDQMRDLKEDIEQEKGIIPQPLLSDEQVSIPQPLEDYSEVASTSGTQSKQQKCDKRFEGKQILNQKDGVVKLSFASYHLKVMNLLASKGVFGKVYNPYKKAYQKVIHATIASIHGDDMVGKVINFIQESYSAYETIFVEGKRSLFGPADVVEDVKQHMAQIVHFFKVNVTEQPLLS